MKFRRAIQRYGKTPVAETPYQRAGQAWDERIGSARVQARNWRLMAFVALLLAAGLSSGLVWQSTQSKVVPYVVEVDQLGEARAIAPASAPYQPTDPQVAWHLGRFISNVRSVSLDPVLMRANWLSAYDFSTGRAATFLNEYARRAAPFSGIGRETVSVEVTNIVRASERSFRVAWTETRYEEGSQSARSRWTAILTVEVIPPADSEALRKNPLGVYVDGIDWAKEIGGDERAEPEASPPSSFASGQEPLVQERAQIIQSEEVRP